MVRMTPMTETLDEIAARHNPSDSRLPECMECGQRWPCDAATLIAEVRKLRDHLRLRHGCDFGEPAMEPPDDLR